MAWNLVPYVNLPPEVPAAHMGTSPASSNSESAPCQCISENNVRPSKDLSFGLANLGIYRYLGVTKRMDDFYLSVSLSLCI